MGERVRRRDLLLGAATVAAGVGQFARAGGEAPKGRVRLGYLQVSWGVAPIIHKDDLLARRGWQAEYTPVPSAPTALINAFAAKNLDATVMSFALAGKMFEDGIPLRMTGVATAAVGAIIARKDVGITRVEDLRGRKIGAIVGSTTFFDIRTLALRVYQVDLARDAQIVTATAPPDLAGLMAARQVDAIVAWSPIADAVVFRGDGVYLAKQLDLWRAATGLTTAYPALSCYLVRPEFLARHPGFAADLNDAQREAVETWERRKDHALAIMQEVTKLPRPVLEFAYAQSPPMLHGLTEEQVEGLLLQLRLTRESGFLKSPVWLERERLLREFFYRP